MRPAVRTFKNESALWMNRLTVPEIPVVYQSYWEGRRIAGQRKEELLGIEKIDEYRGQGGREQGAGAANEGGTATVIYGTDDIANYQYNMIENPGPLAEMPNQPAKNFYGGRYNVEVLQEDKIMYRAGNANNPYGRWFTSEPPASVASVRIDTAVKLHWIDTKTGAWEASSYIDNVYAIKIPKGTTVYTGPVGPQGNVYMGGYNVMQTYIDAPWNFGVIGKTPLQLAGDGRMLKNEDFLQLRVSYIEIGKMVQKYGYGQYNGVLKILMGQINCIDSDENDDEKLQYLLESYNRLFTSRGALSDFVIYDADIQLRKQLNEKYNNEVNKLWAILKDYI